jgi:hypothetical protein
MIWEHCCLSTALYAIPTFIFILSYLISINNIFRSCFVRNKTWLTVAPNNVLTDWAPTLLLLLLLLLGFLGRDGFYESTFRPFSLDKLFRKYINVLQRFINILPYKELYLKTHENSYQPIYKCMFVSHQMFFFTLATYVWPKRIHWIDPWRELTFKAEKNFPQKKEN